MKDYAEALRLDPSNHLAFAGRGDAWYAQGEYVKAVKDYDEAIRLNPKSAWDRTNRGNAWYARMDYDRAIADYDEAIRLDPKDTRAFGGRGNAWYVKNEHANAVADYSEALRLGSQDGNFFDGLAWVLSTSQDAKVRDGKRAVELAKKACAMTKYKTGLHLDTLAAACAEVGQFDDAVRYAEKALTDANFASMRGDEVRLRIEQYKQKIPFRTQ
jgi:tetratricopeptide (TPR) repeat protein